MSDKSVMCDDPSSRIVDDSSTAEDCTSDAPTVFQHTSCQSDTDQQHDYNPTIDFTETLGRLVDGTEGIIFAKRREAAAMSAVPTTTHREEIVPAEYLIDVLKNTVDIDEFAVCEEASSTVVQPQSTEKLYIPVTEEIIDINDISISLENDNVVESSPLLDTSQHAQDTSGLETKQDACGEMEVTPTAVPLRTSTEADCSKTPDDLADKISESQVDTLQGTCELNNDPVMSADVPNEKEGLKETLNSLDVVGTEINSNSISQKEVPIKDLTLSYRNLTQMSGAGDSEYSLEAWTATVTSTTGEGSGLAEEDLKEAAPVVEIAQEVGCSNKELTTPTDADCEKVCLQTEVNATVNKEEDQPSDSTVNVAVTETDEAKLREDIGCKLDTGEAPEKADSSQQTNDDDQWEDVSTDECDCDDSTAEGTAEDSDDGLGDLELEEWEISIPPPPVRTAKDAIRMLQSACCWLERCRVAFEGRRTDQLLLEGGELLRQAARFQPEPRLRKRMLLSAVRTLQAARARCDGSGDATEQRVLVALSQAVLQQRLAAGGPAQLWAAVEALDRLSVVLHANSQPTQLLVPLHVVDDILSASFGS